MSVYNQAIIADTIPISTALSGGVNINGLDPVGLLMPAGWDAAGISLQMSPDFVTWYEVYDSTGTALAWTTAAGRYIALPPATLAGSGYLRIRSGTLAVPVNQTAARTLTWFVRNYGR